MVGTGEGGVARSRFELHLAIVIEAPPDSLAHPYRRLRVADLNNHHRNTVAAIFNHPASGNIEWRQVVSLLEAVGTVTPEHNGKLKVTVGSETEILHVPQGKDIDRQLIVDLRRMLSGAGLAPAQE